ncbi:hypothetical protein C0992_001923 [Termitomyces sp. T32_za158]|nr:hypothetical protein C0992_001923 [Termitomyces sp. T32_za158]
MGFTKKENVLKNATSKAFKVRVHPLSQSSMLISMKGLGPESLRVLAEIQGSATDTGTDINNLNEDPDVWQDEPLLDVPDDSLAHAARDMLDTR